MSGLIVSVHVPKTAGSSLLYAFRSAYGKEAVLRVNDAPLDPKSTFHTDRELYLKQAIREEPPVSARIVHGHFPAIRYKHHQHAFRLTFLRDPVDRLLSHYFFWRESPQQGHTLLDRFKSEDMSILNFAQIPLIANLYTEVFFYATDMASFDFVGDVSKFDEEVERLGKLLGVQLEKHSLRANPHANYHEIVDEVKRDASTMAVLRRLLASDIEFYDRMLSRE